MVENDPWKIKVDLADGVDSTARFAGADGDIFPQRRVLHELIVQAVSERKILPHGDDFEKALIKVIEKVRDLQVYRALEKAGDYSPEKISALLDEVGTERLPLHARAEQVMMVTGGAGTGKSSLVSTIATEKPGVYQNAVQINPDDYKELYQRHLSLTFVRPFSHGD